MDIPPIQRRVDAADISPEKLAGNSQLTEEQKLSEVARQFEAILLRQILESSQKPVIPSKFTDQSTAASIYRDQVTQQLADSISKSGTLGLARTLEHQLTGQLHPASAGPDRKTEAQPTAHALSDAARPGSCSRKPLVNLE
jgi:peptidoglycan hydrolase FlgJ